MYKEKCIKQYIPYVNQLYYVSYWRGTARTPGTTDAPLHDQLHRSCHPRTAPDTNSNTLKPGWTHIRGGAPVQPDRRHGPHHNKL